MGDWVIFSYDLPNRTTSEQRKKIVEIYTKYNPVNFSCSVFENGKRTSKRYIKGWRKELDSGVHNSTSLEEIKKIKDPKGWFSGVYDNKSSVEGVLKELSEGNFGNCTVVSGIFNEVFDATHQTKLAYPHTINMSAETFGRLELLPEPKILEITTMCGHHFVSPNLVKKLINDVKTDRITASLASIELGKQCTCNFFNAARAEKLIKNYITSN